MPIIIIMVNYCEPGQTTLIVKANEPRCEKNALWGF